LKNTSAVPYDFLKTLLELQTYFCWRGETAAVALSTPFLQPKSQFFFASGEFIHFNNAASILY